MKKIDAMRSDIVAATSSASGIGELGKRLVSEHREFAAHAQQGASNEDIGWTWLEEQLRLYMSYSLDRPLWQELVDRSAQFASEDDAQGKLFSIWDEVREELLDNIGSGFGWNGGVPVYLGITSFEQRLRLITSSFEGLSVQQVQQLEAGLRAEESAPQVKSGGCYVATAVYGSYDSPEVRVLRRWRDSYLSTSGVGRQFIRFYYAVSPPLVRFANGRAWFVSPTRSILTRFVRRLKGAGYSDAAYSDGSSNV